MSLCKFLVIALTTVSGCFRYGTWLSMLHARVQRGLLEMLVKDPLLLFRSF